MKCLLTHLAPLVDTVEVEGLTMRSDPVDCCIRLSPLYTAGVNEA
jgi:hypothetical protein